MAFGKIVKVVRRGDGEVLVEAARWCSSRLCRLRGLQFHRRLRAGEGLILVKPADTIPGSTIHMFFVSFPIAAIWINSRGQVTSAQLAKPWRPYYASPQPACYVLETTPDVLDSIHVGDEVDFV
jgi:uncharacterized membrane protein (UPF0127 family)